MGSLSQEPSYATLQHLLLDRATSSQGQIIYYPLGDTKPVKLSYRELCIQANQCSRILCQLPRFKVGQKILLHFDNHWDNIIWFWAALFADGIPVLSSPFSAVQNHRDKHIQALSKLLEVPICITRERSLCLFEHSDSLLQLHTVESLSLDVERLGKVNRQDQAGPNSNYQTYLDDHEGADGLAALMLTSGSTGNAKAVQLRHRQVLKAVSSKASVGQPRSNGPFLNWIGLDHVAGLTEIHLQAMFLGADQVHINTADVISMPTLFLDLLSRHHVCHSFAPNFFLARLLVVDLEQSDSLWDLSKLRMLISGGESNDIKTCVASSEMLQRFGAPRNVITPGFGMTETCAGAIYNTACPQSDLATGSLVASLGQCMEGIEMRVIADSTVAAVGEPGHLEVRGDVVFDGYYRNPEATADAFPLQGGWFRTGDRACIDKGGNLHLIGRTKDVINLNGVKVVATNVDELVGRALGDKVSRFMVFPSRNTDTEQITIAYIPTEYPHSGKSMAELDKLAAEACVRGVLSVPLVFSVSKSSLAVLPTTSLGKIPRTKMSSLFNSGTFDEDVASHRKQVEAYRDKTRLQSLASTIVTEDEAALMNDFAITLGISADMVGPETSIFELGFASMELIRLKRRIEVRTGATLHIIEIMKHPSARLLAKSLGQLERAVRSYDPVVTLKPNGRQAPLWLFHPGVGEVMVFVGLAKQLSDSDRPIYALRARGFEPGEARFSSISEAVGTYVQAIRQHQPHGPYTLAGYSYGAMLAFEAAKVLEALEDNSVHFLGCFNLPPHIKIRMRHLSWNVCLFHLSSFLGLIDAQVVEDLTKSELSAASRVEALAGVVSIADGDRMKELGLNDVALADWVDVSNGLQSMAVDYEPMGTVSSIDVFHAIPLKGVAATRDEWIEEHLSKWRDFTRSEPELHAVDGEHYTMISPEHVSGFAATLKEALKARGI